MCFSFIYFFFGSFLSCCSNVALDYFGLNEVFVSSFKILQFLVNTAQRYLFINYLILYNYIFLACICNNKERTDVSLFYSINAASPTTLPY